MSRLQKKCFVGATTVHGLLLLALLVGPAFFKPKPPENEPILEFIPMMATDEKFSGGGTPRPPSNPQPVVQQPQPTPQPTPPPPEPQRQPERRPEPERVEPPKPVTREKEAPVEKPKPQRHVVQVSDTRVRISPNRTTPTRTSTPTPTPSANTALASAINNSRDRVRSNLSSTTRVDLPEGPGGGGVSYANYGQIVRKVYTDAWHVPDDMTDDEATIKVSVTIARDGKVLSARITQSSGSSAADRSIQYTLDRITHIGVAFPTGAKESERTFDLTFNLKARKGFG